MNLSRATSQRPGADSPTMLLEVSDLHVSYGALEVVRGISVAVQSGEVVALIGGNGAGKTTTLRTISGLLRPLSGEVRFDGEPIHRLRAHHIVERGVAHAPEGRRIFPRMTVLENLELGAFTRQSGRRFRPVVSVDGLQGDLERIFALFPVLAERRTQLAGTLSGGEQQMLAIGRALMSHPRLLMLDEPSMGLAPLITQRILTTLEELRRQGTTILLVEQNAQAALSLADRAYVIETGRVVLTGGGEQLLADPQVRKAYLGED
ncbi:MAG: ABC transporter ATP-binding protein [Actinomycetota bacterium]|nr:ABC transporter ATP-binding protein [Actinomycetota bacterium]